MHAQGLKARKLGNRALVKCEALETQGSKPGEELGEVCQFWVSELRAPGQVKGRGVRKCPCNLAKTVDVNRATGTQSGCRDFDGIPPDALCGRRFIRSEPETLDAMWTRLSNSRSSIATYRAPIHSP